MERCWFPTILPRLNSCKSQLGETKARGANVSFCFMSVSKWIDWNTLSPIKECFQGNVGSLACRAEGISCMQSFGIGEFLEQLFIELFLSCAWKKKKPAFSIRLDKLLSLHIRIILASRNRWNISLLAISMSNYPIPYNHLLLLVYIYILHISACTDACFPICIPSTHISIHEVILFLYIHVM